MSSTLITATTSRAAGPARVWIDAAQCSDCGLCARVCPSGALYVENGRVCADPQRGLGCVGCGHCLAMCSSEAIHVLGRDFSHEDIVPVPVPDQRASYGELHNLLLARRSIRRFTDQPVGPGLIDQIVATAATAPMGVPPSEVGLTLHAGRDKVTELRRDLLASIRRMRWMLSPPGRWLMRPFMGAAGYDVWCGFVAPLATFYLQQDAKGEDVFFHDAPLAIHVHTTPHTDATDAVIVGTYLMLAAEAMGLGVCVLGFPPPLFNQSIALRRRHCIPPRNKVHMTMVIGHPAVRFRRAIRRRLAQITYA